MYKVKHLQKGKLITRKILGQKYPKIIFQICVLLKLYINQSFKALFTFSDVYKTTSQIHKGFPRGKSEDKSGKLIITLKYND